jgi:MFS family permease
MRQCGRPTCLDDFLGHFRALGQSPRSLVVVLVISFIDSFAYFAFSYALIIHLGREVGLPDSMAGLFYGIFGVCISVSGVFLGFAVDWLGVRNSICAASAAGFVTRLAMAYAVLGRSKWLSTLILCAGVGPCIALMLPPIPIALKRYTTTATRDMVYTINYGVMNAAAAASTALVDVIRMYWGNDIVLMLPPYALLIAFTGMLQLPIFFAALFGLRDEIMDETTGQIKSFVPPNVDNTLVQRMREVLRQPNFWKAVTLVICLMGAKSAFRYFDALYLPYVSRAFQDAATFPYLMLLAMNPAICIASTITGAITIFTARLEPVSAMILGTLIGGVAPFWMATGPYVSSIMLYVLFTTLGEIVWATVAISYFMGLTTTGHEGAYSALAGLPTFMAKLLTGALTGGLMARFCPERKDANGMVIPPPPPQLWGSPAHCNGFAIWSIIGVTTVSSALLLFMCRKRIHYKPVPKILDLEGTDNDDADSVEMMALSERTGDDVESDVELLRDQQQPPLPRRTQSIAVEGTEVTFPTGDPIPFDADRDGGRGVK